MAHQPREGEKEEKRRHTNTQKKRQRRQIAPDGPCDQDLPVRTTTDYLGKRKKERRSRANKRRRSDQGTTRQICSRQAPCGVCEGKTMLMKSSFHRAVPFLSENCWARDRKESGKKNSEFCPTSGHLFAFHPLYLSSFQKVFFFGFHLRFFAPDAADDRRL